MSQTVRTEVAAPTVRTLVLDIVADGDSCVVHATGELDVASRRDLLVASTAGTHRSTVIDFAEVTFMDCSGYGCLVAARVLLEGGGRTLTIRGHTGQPKRLIDLIAAFDDARRAGGAQQRGPRVSGGCRPAVLLSEVDGGASLGS